MWRHFRSKIWPWLWFNLEIRTHNCCVNTYIFFADDLQMVYIRPLQKQPCRGVLSKKTRACPNYLLCNFIKIKLRHGCSPVNWLHIFRAPFPRNTSRRLLLLLLDHRDIIYNQENNTSFHQRTESLKYNVVIVVTDISGGVSIEKTNQELYLESLQQICCYFFKFFKSISLN